MKRLIAPLVGISALALVGCRAAKANDQTQGAKAQPAQPAAQQQSSQSASASQTSNAQAATAGNATAQQETAKRSSRSSQMVKISRAELQQLHRTIRDLQARAATGQTGMNRGTGGAGSAGMGRPMRVARRRGRSQTPLASATFSGRVLRVSPDRVSVADEDGAVYQLAVDDQTRVLQNGKAVGLQALKPGSNVLASFDELGMNNQHARTLEIGAGQGGSGQAGVQGRGDNGVPPNSGMGADVGAFNAQSGNF